ncbi:MAG: hypothetical protein HGA37_01645 [Lentimicrobium sp.]|nr:hypothetical protein [Lentimicrobium sp.]
MKNKASGLFCLLIALNSSFAQQYGWAVGTQRQITYSSESGYDWNLLEHNLTDELLTGVLFTSVNNGTHHRGRENTAELHD